MLGGLASKKWENVPCLSVSIFFTSGDQSRFYWPIYRIPIDPGAVERFTVHARTEETPPTPKPGTTNKEAVPKSRREITYNMIGNFDPSSVNHSPWAFPDAKLLWNIQSMESFGDFGNKIQTLVRHLLYLQMTDLGAKSIVFSAWADSLHSTFIIISI